MRRALAIILLVLVAARAHAQQGDSPIPAVLDTCPLVTAAELQAIVHQAVQGPREGGANTCIWQIGGMNAITVQYNASGQAGFDNAKALTSDTKPAAGVGDAAFVFISAAGFDAVHLVRHNRYVVVTYQGDNPGQRLDASLAIATKVASRL